MAGGYTINAILNTSRWTRGTQEMEGSLEDLQDTLKQTENTAQGLTLDEALDKAKAASKGMSREMVKGFLESERAAGKTADEIKSSLVKSYGVAEDAAEDLARESKEGFRKLEDGAEDAGDETKELEKRLRKVRDEADDVGKKGKDSMRKFGDSANEVSGELKQNLGETFSSFRGDLEDIPQLAQDVFGGLASSVGTLPAAFGLAAGAAGVGLLVAAFQGLQEEEEARKERVAEWAQAYIDAAGQIEGAVASLAAVESIYTDPETYSQAEKNAKNWGVTVSTAVNAMAGDMTALSIVEENLSDNSDIVGEALDKTGGDARGLSYEMRQLKDQTGQGQDAFDKLTGEMAEGEAIANNYARSLFDLASSTGTATGEVDDLGNKIVALPDGTEVVISAETGKAYADVDTLENKVNAMPDGQVAVYAAIGEAQRVLNNFVSDNDGKTIKIYGRYISPEGSSIP